MAKNGTITLRTGTSKAGKDYKALELTVGSWTALYFPKSAFEMEYLEKYLTSNPTPDEATSNGNILEDSLEV